MNPQVLRCAIYLPFIFFRVNFSGFVHLLLYHLIQRWLFAIFNSKVLYTTLYIGWVGTLVFSPFFLALKSTIKSDKKNCFHHHQSDNKKQNCLKMGAAIVDAF